MYDGIQKQLEVLLQQSLSFPASDPLVHLDSSKNSLIQLQKESSVIEYSAPLRKIIQHAKKEFQETGANPLCIAKGLLTLEHNGERVNSPVVLIPCQWKINKIDNSLILQPEEGAAFINPFLDSWFRSKDILIDDLADTSIINSLAEINKLLIDNKLLFLGNFHHHRFQVIKELDLLTTQKTYSDALLRLLGEEKVLNNQLPQTSPYYSRLFSCNVEQEKALELADLDHLVIHGPPGTGKSQVLSNLVAQSLSKGEKLLLTSAKRSALTVIVKRLSEFQLDHLCFIATADELNKQLIQELKENWVTFEKGSLSGEQNFLQSPLILQKIQNTLDLLNQRELVGGLSFSQFRSYTRDINLEVGQYHSQHPNIKEFQVKESWIQHLYQSGLNWSLSRIAKSIIQSDRLLPLDRVINDLVNELRKLPLEVELFGDLDNKLKLASAAQLNDKHIVKRHPEIIRPDSKQQKSFLQLSKKLKKLELELEQLKTEELTWNKVPNYDELILIEKLFQTPGFLQQRKAKKVWKKYSSADSSLAQTAIQKRKVLLDKEADLSRLKIKFCDLGLLDPDREIPELQHFIAVFDDNAYASLQNIPSDDWVKYAQATTAITRIKDQLKLHFVFQEKDHLLNGLLQIQKDLPELFQHAVEFRSLSSEMHSAIGKTTEFETLKQEVIHSNWVRFKAQFPQLSDFNPQQLKLNIDNYHKCEVQEFASYAQAIKDKFIQRFQEYHELLNTPSTKLTAREKELKSELKKGKSLLVKEFKKSRRFMSLRELMESPAAYWISILKPVWLTNPTQVGKCFPMETELFDLCLFDEASQLPLSHALGAIQRSKRIVIAGDEQQMGPSSYFKSGGTDEVDLLHQASFYFDGLHLKEHFRSVHPDLISFSNRHFYNNQLSCYPFYGAKGPFLHQHFVEGAIYENRHNVMEAKVLAEHLTKALRKPELIGLVAFSEEQLSCILGELNSSDLDLLNERIDTGTAFAKALENVQGDECDILLISFGYGKDKEGKFALRFGPMNGVNGRKRLNVLLTRARKSLHFYCSVTSEEFKISSNESVNLIRQWFLFLEQYQGELPATNPIDNNMILDRLYEDHPVARSFISYIAGLENRGWKVNLV